MTDWTAVRAAYEAGAISTRKLAKLQGLKSDNAIRERAKREGWKRAPAQPPAHTATAAQRAQSGAQREAPTVAPLAGTMARPAGRDEAGRFLPGQSGNPTGKNGGMPEI